MAKIKNKYFKIIVIIIVALMAFAIIEAIIEPVRNIIKSKKMPPKLTVEDIEVIEVFAGIQFPDSTEFIKTYWDAWDSEKLYLFFKFKKEDEGQFLKGLRWKKGDFISYKGQLNWRKLGGPDEINVPLSVPKTTYSLSSEKPELLEWWVINKGNVKWGYNIYEAAQKKTDIILHQSMLLEESGEIIRGFVFLAWNSFAESDEYVKKIREIMPFGYKERQRESESYPKRKEKILDATSISEGKSNGK